MITTGTSLEVVSTMQQFRDSTTGNVDALLITNVGCLSSSNMFDASTIVDRATAFSHPFMGFPPKRLHIEHSMVMYNMLANQGEGGYQRCGRSKISSLWSQTTTTSGPRTAVALFGSSRAVENKQGDTTRMHADICEKFSCPPHLGLLPASGSILITR